MLEYIENKPKWLTSADYLTVMGSRAYGTETENSDWDFYGFVIPPIDILFPHTKGEIPGFGRNIQRFEQFEMQHTPHSEYGQFDITVYNIVKYFQLLMEGNPNLIDSIFTDDDCVLEKSFIGKKVKSNRHLFLSQKCYHTFKGMMWSHLSRLKSGHVKEGRKEDSKKYGWDVKDGYHSVRMIFQLEQILFTGDVDLKKYSNTLLGIRNGRNTLDEVIEFCENKLIEFEDIVRNHPKRICIPYSPDEKTIHSLLVDCLEEKYGNLDIYGYGIYV